jgi:nitrogen regulatory protein PII
MKLVVAYVAPESFESIRETLLGLGFPSLSALNAAGTSPEPAMTTVYRGTETEQYARANSRLECVVGDEHVATVVDTVLKEGGERVFAYVVSVDGAYPVDTVKADEEAISVR